MRFHFRVRVLAYRLNRPVKRSQLLIGESLFNCSLFERSNIGKPHSIGGEHTGQRMNVNPLHAQRVGDHACVLSARAAKAGQRIFRHVVAALNADVFDRIRHIFDCDAQKSCGNRLVCHLATGCLFNFLRKTFEFPMNRVAIKGLIAIRSENGGK